MLTRFGSGCPAIARLNIRQTETPSILRAFDAETDQPARPYVHDQQHPVTVQKDRFAAEQVDAPEAILHVTDEGQPRGAVGSGVAWSVVLREHAAHDIFVDVDAEGMSNLLGDAYTAKARDCAASSQRWPR